MIILALDIATSTGWAMWMGGECLSGTQVFKLARGESPGMRFLRFDKWLNEMVETMRPDVIAFERPSFFRSQAAGEVVHGLLSQMQKIAAAQNINTSPVGASELKKHATGKGNAKKPDMQAAAMQRWCFVETPGEDEADALCILAWSMEQLGIRTRVQVRKTR